MQFDSVALLKRASDCVVPSRIEMSRNFGSAADERANAAEASRRQQQKA